MRYAFGPVPSWRLSRSLGVDLVLFKVCSYDCIFCQLRHTTEKTTEMRPHVPVGEVLIIGDNTDEAIFDSFLMREFLPRRISFTVRARLIINDITMAETRTLGIDQVATIVDSRSPLPGMDLARATPEFRRLFDETPVVIAKGQGNCETLSDCRRHIFFFLKVKCPVVARLTGKPEGSSVLVRGGVENQVAVG